MEILAHRGVWNSREEQNTRVAFERAWRLGAGIETDVRDLAGQLVISHDMPSSPDLMTLSGLLRAWSESGRTGRLALNVKADGLSHHVSRELHRWGAIEHAFVFDMSVPDQMAHCRAGNPVLTRWSDVEEPPALLALARGLWLDAFTSDDWWRAGDVAAHADAGRDVVFVSPELHGRDHVDAWRRIADAGLHRSSHVSLCTDFVAEARTFFNGADSRLEVVGA